MDGMSRQLAAIFGRNLRHHRLRSGLTQERFAEQVDITPEYLSNLERGVSTPSFGLLEQLADALHTRPDALLRPVVDATAGNGGEVRPRGRSNADALFFGVAPDITAEQRAQDAAEHLARYISHEVRNATTAVAGILQPLSDDGHAQAHRIRLAIGALAELSDFADMVLAGASTTGPSEHLPTEPVAVEPIVLRIIARYRAMAEEHGIAVTYDGHECVVQADPMRLAHVLSNLIGNAVKFTATGGVTLRCSHDDDGHASIRVIDTGPGIPPDRLAELLSKDGSPASRPGHGMGMRIAVSLTEAMGGSVSAESDPGSGTTFTVRLPTAEIDAVSTRRTAKPATRAATVTLPSEHIGGDGGTRDALATARGVRAPRSILLVEDTAIAMIWLRSILVSHGHTVIKATDAAGALAAADRHPIDIAVVDVQLPDGDGVDLAKRLRTRLSRTDLPVILTSALVDDRLRERAGGIHRSVLLTKPFDDGALLCAINDLARE